MRDLKIFNRNTDLGLLILRLSVGILMLFHGIYKLYNGIGPIETQITEMGLPFFFAYGVYLGEVLASVLIILGVATRIGGAIMVINCIVAIWMVHTADISSFNAQGGWALELLGLYMFGALALVFTGGGKYAISHKFIWD